MFHLQEYFSIIHEHIKPWVHVYQVKYLFLLLTY